MKPTTPPSPYSSDCAAVDAWYDDLESALLALTRATLDDEAGALLEDCGPGVLPEPAAPRAGDGAAV
jgi:hypothetical protein